MTTLKDPPQSEEEERFGDGAEAIRPLGRILRSEDMTSSEDRKSREEADKALEEG
jgi:hypothetical protein